MDCKPWVEKYRPTNFDDIVLETDNRILLKNIIEKNHFPNLLLYGPPGTGKTTTIINLIKKYNNVYKQHLKSVIHLNASDDRGIDIIRNQINQFVNTKSIFGNGIKFVILDEVDYMTKNAQQALRYLIQQHSNQIRFCLICNYISKIDKSLQNEFIKLCFSNLPKKDIFVFLKNISKKENLNINDIHLKHIQIKFNSDIRSMINYIQTNHNNICINNIITKETWEKIILMFKNKKTKTKQISLYIKNYCTENNISIKSFIAKFIDYHINNKNYALNKSWLNFFQTIIHCKKNKDTISFNYFVAGLYELYCSL